MSFFIEITPVAVPSLCSCLRSNSTGSTRELTRVKRLAAFRNVGQQNVYKRVLAIERRASLVFGCDDSLDRREVALAKRVVLLAIKAFPPS